jgi:hypothetical protein
MKKEYSNNYEDLYNRHIDNQFQNGRKRLELEEYYLLRVAKNAIDHSIDQKEIRSDAFFFILVNFHFMIIKPIVHKSKNTVPFTENKDIESAIVSDINLILSTAIEESIESEISGHHILNIIDRLWKKMKTTRFEIWG